MTLALRRLSGWSGEGWRRRAAVSVLLCSVYINAGICKQVLLEAGRGRRLEEKPVWVCA